MEIEKIKAEKTILEAELRRCINEFTEKTGCCPYRVDISIEQSMRRVGVSSVEYTAEYTAGYTVGRITVAIEI